MYKELEFVVCISLILPVHYYNNMFLKHGTHYEL